MKKDYQKYHMKPSDYMQGFLIGFGIAFVTLYIFFRMLPISFIVGVLVGILAVFVYRRVLVKRQKKNLLLQFKDLLEMLSASYATGKNTTQAFEEAYRDLVTAYGEDADITKEIKALLDDLKNGYTVEYILQDFARRSTLEDVESFADVFEVCHRQGANIQEVVANTRSLINEKIEMEMEIDNMLNAGKNELYIMMIMPLVVMLVMSADGSMSVGKNTPVNVLVKFIALVIFIAAFFVGRKITNLKV